MDQSNQNGSLKMPLGSENQENQKDYSGLTPPEPMGSLRNANTQQYSYSPRPTPPKQSVIPPSTQEKPKSNLGPCSLMSGMGLILVIGILVFISWKGWISLGGPATPKPTGSISARPSSSVSPSIQTSPSPELTSSPEVTTNINDQTRKADLSRIKTALDKYGQANNKFPESAVVIRTSETNSLLAQALVPQYLDKLPDDPLAPQYYYGYTSDGLSYELTCILEDKTDPEGNWIGNKIFLYKLTGSL